MLETDLNKNLRNGIELHNVNVVQTCLNNGANPNHFKAITEFGADQSLQPTTPLCLVVFCISDSLLDDNDLKQFAEITKLLLKHGADPKPAIELAELRYGKYDKVMKGPFMDVLHIISNAK